jgi:hypothetical protein
MENLNSKCKQNGETMSNKTFGNWLKSCSWVCVSSVAILGYLSQRQWFVSVTSSWIVGMCEGACLSIAICIFVYNYGDSLAEVYNGLRELGRLRKKKRRKVND